MARLARRRSAIGLDVPVRKRTDVTKKLTPQDVADDGYEAYRAHIRERVKDLLRQQDGKVFRTDAKGLFETYLRALPAKAKKYCNCNTCRKFFDEYAGLVVIDSAGKTHPLLWNLHAIQPTYTAANAALYSKVKRANVVGVKLWDKMRHGNATTGVWSHYAFDVPLDCLTVSKLKATHELEAEKREEFGIIDRALGDWTLRTLDTAVELLETDSLYRAEKVLAPVKWLRDLQAQVRSSKNAIQRRNLIWRAVAYAPTGFCHPRSAVTASLLDDIQAGKTYATYSKAFAAKMHPLRYQRPQAAPKAGNVLAATRLVEKMGIAPSLVRRFADVAECPLFWRPASRGQQRTSDEIAAGPFANVQPRTLVSPVQSTRSVPKTMTWVKFRDTLLDAATRVELYAETGPYYAITGAVYADAPPILKWDHADRRNSYGWYTYITESSPGQWGLQSCTWVDVVGITPRPCHWTADTPQYAEAAFLLLQDAMDQRNTSSALFPEMLHSELHSIRATIEAHSKQTKLQPPKHGAAACGWVIAAGDRTQHTKLRVTTTNNLVFEVTIDRWD